MKGGLFSFLENEKITHVAIVYEGELYILPAPNRYHNVIKFIYDIVGKPLGRMWQGFLTGNGKFVSREEAVKIAQKAGQIGIVRPKTSSKDILFSEDVW